MCESFAVNVVNDELDVMQLSSRVASSAGGIMVGRFEFVDSANSGYKQLHISPCRDPFDLSICLH